MPSSEAYVGHLLGFWDCVTGASMHRWSNAVREARARRYDSTALMSDVVGAIDDATNAWCAVLAGPKRSEPVLFDIWDTTQSSGQVFPIFRPSCPEGAPQIVWIGAVGDVGRTGHSLAEGHVHVYWSGHSGLEVRLSDLGNPNPHAAPPVRPGKLKTGLYRLLVHIRQTVILEVYVKVSGAPAVTPAQDGATATAPPRRVARAQRAGRGARRRG